MREVDDSPNRCPRCQRVQLSAEICHKCALIVKSESFTINSSPRRMLAHIKNLTAFIDKE